MPMPGQRSSPSMDDGGTAAALTGLVGRQRELAWDRLVSSHGPDVWRLISSRSRDAHEAEDAYQEFWLRLPAAATGFVPDGSDPERAARAWLMRVAYTTAIDHLRRRRAATRRDVRSDCEAEAPMDEPEDPHGGMLERVREAMESLPEAQRRPLVLHLVAGLSYEELAADLSCTVNNARVKVHRALQRLRQAIGVDAERLPDASIAGLLVPPFLLPVAVPAIPPPGALPPPLPPAGPLAVFAKAPLLATACAVATTAAVAGTAYAVITTVSTVRHEDSAMPATRPVAATVLAVGALAAADVLDDFERDDPALVGRGDAANAVVTIVPAPAGLGHGKALRIAWPESHGIWVDCGYPKTRPAPALVKPTTAVVTMSLWADAFAGIGYVAVRFNDAQGETFEWRGELPNPGQAGWRTLKIAIDPAKPAGHWGGEKPNASIDFPLALKGYAIRLAEPKTPAGSIVIDDVAVTADATH